MSAAPTYTPTTSFSSDETNQAAGRSTVRTAAVDVELANIGSSINALKSNIDKIQRDDDKLKDFIVEPYALSEQARALIASKGSPRGLWLPGTVYAVGDVVQQASIAYQCYEAHTSGSSFTASGLWIAISGDGSSAASASAAATSATSATNSATSATSSATSATNSATSATNSATSATNSATSATNSATASAASATSAAASLDSFDDRYLGVKAADPTLDNDGNALITGALYFNSTSNTMQVRKADATWGATVVSASSFIATLLDDADAATARTTLGAQTLDAELTTLAGMTSAQATSLATVPPLHQNDSINGDFRIAQAGTSFAAPVSGAYDLDGWLNTNTSAAVFTVAQVAGSTAGRLARQVTITTADATVAAGDVMTDEMRIEGYNIEKYVGNTFIVAFRKKVPVAGIHCVALRNLGNDRSYVVEINFPVANVVQDCSFAVVGGLPTAGTWNYTNGIGLSISFAHMCGTTFQTTPNAWNTGNFLGTANQVNDCATVGNVWAMEKVTLNLGTIAAVSEISYEAELVRCQRYFWQGGAASSGSALKYSAATTAAMEVVSVPFVPPMRATPTVLIVTAPAYVNCANVDVIGSASGIQHRVTVAATGTFRADGGVYSAATRL